MEKRTRYVVYALRKTAARSPNIYTSSATQTARYYFTSTESFYIDLMSPAKMQRTLNLHINCPISTKFGISRQIFIKSSSIKFKGNPSIGSRADTYRLMDGHDKGNGGS
jgi:hypothetical protein